MLKGTTSTGFEFEIPKKRLKNYELVEAIAEEGTNPLAVVKVVKLLLGDEAERLKDHVRDEDGMVDLELVAQELKEIFESNKETKN